MTYSEFKERFMPLQKMLYREAFRLLCDRYEAEDAVQNLYLKLWERKGELKCVITPEAYCRTLLRNICIDRLRSVERALPVESDVTSAQISTYSPPDIEKKEVEWCLEHFLAGLSIQHKQIFEMRMNGCSFEEIECVTGISQVNVRVIISRVRKKFREFYNKL